MHCGRKEHIDYSEICIFFNQNTLLFPEENEVVWLLRHINKYLFMQT